METRRVLKLFTIGLLLASVGTLGLSSIHYAMAMMSPALGISPTQPFVGGTGVITIGDGLDPPHRIDNIRMYDPDSYNVLDGFPCVAGDLPGNRGAATASVWELQNEGGTKFTSEIRVPAVGDVAQYSVDFAPGIQTISKTEINTGSVSTSADINFDRVKWVDIINGEVPAFDLPTAGTGNFPLWLVATCGRENVNNNNVEFVQPFSTNKQFDVGIPVAGMLLSLDKTALYITSIQTSAVWILPLVGATRVGFGIFKIIRRFC